MNDKSGLPVAVLLGLVVWLVTGCAANRVPNSAGATSMPCPPYSVAVRVFDGTGEPSVHAYVRVKGARVSGVTDDSGSVVLTSVPHDTFTLEALAAGWKPVSASVTGRPCGRDTVQLRFSTKTYVDESRMAIPEKSHP